MLNPRTLLGVVAMAIVGLTSMASGALATPGPLVMTNEESGIHCPAVQPSDSSEFPLQSNVTGGCVEHVTDWEGEVRLTAHIFGVESTDSVCESEFTMHIGSLGEGYLVDISLTEGMEGLCARQPCGTDAGAPEAWEIHGEETSAGVERFELHFCVENDPGPGGRTTCHVFLPFVDTNNPEHEYEFGTVGNPGGDTPVEIGCEGFTGFRGELSGHWETEGGAIEARHGT